MNYTEKTLLRNRLAVFACFDRRDWGLGVQLQQTPRFVCSDVNIRGVVATVVQVGPFAFGADVRYGR